MLSPQQIKQYHETGFIVVPDVVSQADIAVLRTGTERIVAGAAKRAMQKLSLVLLLLLQTPSPAPRPATKLPSRRGTATRVSSRRCRPLLSFVAMVGIHGGILATAQALSVRSPGCGFPVVRSCPRAG